MLLKFRIMAVAAAVGPVNLSVCLNCFVMANELQSDTHFKNIWKKKDIKDGKRGQNQRVRKSWAIEIEGTK